MANPRWRGDAPAVAQVDSLTPANVEIGDVFTATINGKSITFTATAATVANVTAGIVAAWNVSTIPEFAEITAADMTTYVKLTADTAGKPFTVTSAATDGGVANTQTFTQANVTACTGPNFYDVAANWSTNAVPTTGDNAYVDSGSDILYGLSNAGNTLASFNVAKTFTGKIGLPYINQDGQLDYIEYRNRYLAIDSTIVNIGTGIIAPGSGRILINTGTVQTTVNVYDTGPADDQGIGAFVWKGTHASNALNILTDAGGGGATIDVAREAGETATILTLNVQDGAVLWLGSGVTLTNLTYKQSGGEATFNSATSGTATLTIDYGTLNLLGTAGHLGLTVRGGLVVYNTTGTLGGAPVVSGSGVLDFSQDLRTKTVTNPVDVYGDQAKVLDPHKVVGTLVVDLDEGGKSENIDWGNNVRLTRGTPA